MYIQEPTRGSLACKKRKYIKNGWCFDILTLQYKNLQVKLSFSKTYRVFFDNGNESRLSSDSCVPGKLHKTTPGLSKAHSVSSVCKSIPTLSVTLAEVENGQWTKWIVFPWKLHCSYCRLRNCRETPAVHGLYSTVV